jgi:acyl-CoA reductase-like NAD-dependent aldehyde dehydrogenase
VSNAVNGCIAGIFAASGQTCVAGSRLFLHAKVHDAFVEQLVERTKRIKLGDPSIMEVDLAETVPDPFTIRIWKGGQS